MRSASGTAWTRSARVGVQRPARQGLRSAVLFGGVGCVGHIHRLIVAIGNPDHQPRKRDLDERSQKENPHPQWHLAMVLLPCANATQQLRGAARDGAGGARRERERVPALPSVGGLARAGRARAPCGFRRSGLLGPACSRLRRPTRACAVARSRAGRSRRQSHRAHVHRRSLRGFPIRRALARGLCQPALIASARRRPRAERRVDHRSCTLRAGRLPLSVRSACRGA